MRALFVIATMMSACAAKDAGVIVDAGSGLSARPVAASCKASTFSTAPPTAWSQSGCANRSDPRDVDSGLLFYDVNVPGWYDGLTAARYLAIPTGATITVNADNTLTYPDGTVIVQQLSDSARLVETRVLALDTTWTALSYEWGAKDATPVGAAGDMQTFDGAPYLFSPRAACFACHNETAGTTLGSTIGQLDRSIVYVTSRVANQLDTWAAIGLLNGSSLPTPRPQFSGPLSGASFNERARSYLDANCANCHRGGVDDLDMGTVDLDLRYTTPFAMTNLCEPSAITVDGLIDPARITPGDPSMSALSLVLRTTDSVRQPPVGTLRPDAVGTSVIDEWIATDLPDGGCD